MSDLFNDVENTKPRDVQRAQEEDSILFVSNTVASGPIRRTERVYSFNGLAWSQERGLVVVTNKSGYDGLQR
jgi:hypothetical protein